MGQFYAQYEKIKPYLLNNGQNPPAREHLQTPEQRENSMGCGECILAPVNNILPVILVETRISLSSGGLLAAYRFRSIAVIPETDSRLKG